MKAPPRLPELFHIGWVVRDCAAAQEELSARLGAGPFVSFGDESRFDQALVHGKPTPFALKVAFGALGGVGLPWTRAWSKRDSSPALRNGPAPRRALSSACAAVQSRTTQPRWYSSGRRGGAVIAGPRRSPRRRPGPRP